MNALKAILAVGLIVVFAGATGAEQIAVNTHLSDSLSDGIVGTTDTAGAGAYAQDNWNDKAFNSQSWSVVNLTDANNSSGVATTMDVTWTAGVAATGDMWKATRPAADNSDNRMMAYAAMVQKIAASDGTMTVDVSSIPYASYDLVIYYNHADVNPNSPVELGFTIGATTLTAQSSNAYTDGTYDLSDGAGSDGNYLVFTGLTGSSFSLLQTQLTDTYWNAGMTGFQIVEIPEPATMSLLALGGLGALIRRRRRS